MATTVLAFAALAAGDGAEAQEAREAAGKHMSVVGEMGAMSRYWNAEAALAGGDLAAARGWADDAVSATKGFYLSLALTGRARVLMAQGEPKQAESDAHDALTRAAEIEAHLVFPTSSRSSPIWPERPAVTAKPRGSSARHRPSGNAWGGTVQDI